MFITNKTRAHNAKLSVFAMYVLAQQLPLFVHSLAASATSCTDEGSVHAVTMKIVVTTTFSAFSGRWVDGLPCPPEFFASVYTEVE